MIEPGLKAAHGQRTLTQKYRQIRAAQALEAAWSKDRILEAYLNLASYRGEIAGLGAASRLLFAKRPSGLDADESALAVSLLRSPNATADDVAARACRLNARLALGADCTRLTALATHALSAHAATPSDALAPQLAHQLLGRQRRSVTSTLDASLQRLAIAALQRQLAALADRNVRDGAVLVVDNASGEVLAYVANAGEVSSARHVDGIRARRQAGSTLKPFLYELAIERRLLTAASLLDDSPVNLTTPGGLYVPQNYDHQFKGLVSLRESLSGSLNIPAVRGLMLVGLDPFVTRLRTLGFRDLAEDGEYYGYSLALGSGEVTLWQLVNAYRTLANGGVAGPLVLEPGAHETPANVPLATPEFAAAAFVVGDVLADRGSRSLTFGLESPLATPFWSAVKTGTSKNMRDNWCVGYSTRYTVGVWVGNFDGAPMWDVSGLSGAAPVWAELMRRLHASEPGPAPQPPAGVVATEVSFPAGREATRREWFLAGTETRAVTAKDPARSAPRITYPGRDSILVIDPDIPRDHQRVYFAMSPAREDAHWRLNGKPFSAGDWTPEPGTWRLAIVDDANHVVDEIGFTVRGRWRR
jgi:penicillin-binding protein 1C